MTGPPHRPRWLAPFPAALGIPGDPGQPCVRRCSLDDRDICVGCLRSLDEILGWHAMTDEDRARIMVTAVTRGRQP